MHVQKFALISQIPCYIPMCAPNLKQTFQKVHSDGTVEVMEVILSRAGDL